jgi:hypothetical protein
MSASDFYKPGSSYTGWMAWWGAMAWADQLSVSDSVRNQTLSDWRLPTVAPVNGSAFNYNLSYIGATDFGWNLSAPGTVYAGSTASELAYMYYNNLLGNVPYCSPDGTCPQPGWAGVLDPSFVDAATGLTKSFQNLPQSVAYWSGADSMPDPPSFAWVFGTRDGGYQTYTYKSHGYGGWAVRDGDVARSVVPVPAPLWLIGAGFLSYLGVGVPRWRVVA